MNNPGIYNLGDVALAAINAATVATVVTLTDDAVAYISDLEGMIAATFQVNWNWGSGGTSVKVTIETSLDQGTTWVEVARMAFATASEENLVNLSGVEPIDRDVQLMLSQDCRRRRRARPLHLSRRSSSRKATRQPANPRAHPPRKTFVDGSEGRGAR
jgi:hypothetical protein